MINIIRKKFCTAHIIMNLCSIGIQYIFIYLSQSLNQWALLSTRLFRQPNYWRSTSYATYLTHMWTPMNLSEHAHACLHCKEPRQRFISSWLQGRLQLSGGEHSQQRQHSKEQSTLTTRLRRRHS